MIELETLPLPDPRFEPCDADFLSPGDYLLTSSDGRVHSPHFEIATRKKWVLARKINDDFILVLERRAPGSSKNGFIHAPDGTVVKDFLAGDAIEDAVVTESHIVLSYFDEGIYGSQGPNLQGVAVFDLWGQYLFGYHEQFPGSVTIDDCYALCASGPDRVLFFAYSDFPLVELDLESRTQTIRKPPAFLHGAHALSARGGNIFFGGPRKDKQGIHWLKPDGRLEKLGEFRGQLLGGRNGTFLQVDAKSVSVVKIET